MKIGIIGSGNMGRSLGIVWTELGHEVFFGSRDPEQGRRAAALTNGKARFGTNDEAALFGDVLLYSLRGIPPSEALQQVNSLDNKIVIDLNNSTIPPDFAYEPITISLAEKLQQEIPRARVVKAYNTFPQEIIERFPNEIHLYQVSTFIAGDDPAARNTVIQLSRELGLDPIDCGPLRRARLIEGLGDFIRFTLISGVRPDGNFSIVNVPEVEKPRLGGREQSKLK